MSNSCRNNGATAPVRQTDRRDRRAYRRAYYLKHRDRIRAKVRAYYQAHRRQIAIKKSRAYHAAKAGGGQ
jgi:hypothetical protein